MAFDISKEKEKSKLEDQGTFVHLNDREDLPMFYDVDGEQQPVGITIAGLHSSQARRVDAALRKRKLRRKDLTHERVYEDSIEKMARLTLSWQGIQDQGQDVRCDIHNARMLYDACPWVLEQVSEAAQDHTRFFSTESTPSESTSDISADSTPAPTAVPE